MRNPNSLLFMYLACLLIAQAAIAKPAKENQPVSDTPIEPISIEGEPVKGLA